jgi:hypothetical protein
MKYAYNECPLACLEDETKETGDPVPRFDNIRCLLRNSVHSRLQMRRRYQRNDARVDYAQLPYAINCEIAAYTSTQTLRHHGAGARHVCEGSRETVLLDKRIDDLIIRLKLRAG